MTSVSFGQKPHFGNDPAHAPHFGQKPHFGNGAAGHPAPHFGNGGAAPHPQFKGEEHPHFGNKVNHLA